MAKSSSMLKEAQGHWMCEDVFAALVVERADFKFLGQFGARFYGWVPSKVDGISDVVIGELYLTCSEDGWSVYRTVNVLDDLKFTPWVLDPYEKQWLTAVLGVARAWAMERKRVEVASAAVSQ